MNNQDDTMSELRRLLVAVDASEASDYQIERLNSILTESPVAGLEAASILDQINSLRDADPNRLRGGRKDLVQGESKVYDLAKPQEAIWHFSRWQESSWISAVAVALLLTHLAVAGITWQWISRSASVAALDANRLPAEFCGSEGQAAESVKPQLVSMTGCVWDSSSGMKPSLGQSLPHGEVLSLREGIAELLLGSDPLNPFRVRIEGPAGVYIRSDGLLGLRYGALTADVRRCRDEFAIDTPAGRVAIKDSAYIGVIADGQRDEVHVFRGQAELLSSWSGTEKPLALLSEGDAAVVTCDLSKRPSVDSKSASLQQFASARSMAFDQLSLDKSYPAAILDSNPSLYWRFDGKARLTNLGSSAHLDGVVRGGIRWRSFGDNQAAEFGSTETAGSFLSDETWPKTPLDSYTIELWAKPSHFHNGALIGLTGEATATELSPHAMLIEIGGPYGSRPGATPPNSIRFLHRSPASSITQRGTSCIADSPYHLRSWQHICARKTSGELNLFVNGKVVASQKDSSPLPAGMKVLVGQLYPDLRSRPFVGQIDELAIYEKALTVKDILQHYRLGASQLSDDDAI